jgi:hypothetical protein
MKTDLDLYSDYLLVSFGQSTSTGLSRLLDKSISHDDVTEKLYIKAIQTFFAELKKFKLNLA